MKLKKKIIKIAQQIAKLGSSKNPRWPPFLSKWLSCVNQIVEKLRVEVLIDIL